MQILRLDHIHVYASDPEASAQFYESCFGARRTGNTRTSRGGTMQFLNLGGLALVLAPYPPGTLPGEPTEYTDGTYQRTAGVAHIGLQVDCVEDAVESLRRHGVQVLAKPRVHAGLHFAYVGAPDGVIIELLQYGGAWAEWLGAERAA